MAEVARRAARRIWCCSRNATTTAASRSPCRTSHSGSADSLLIDDLVSSGRTMIETARGLRAQGFPAPVCVTVHTLFAEDAFAQLSKLASQVVSTDTVPHPSNAIPIGGLVAEALKTEF